MFHCDTVQTWTVICTTCDINKLQASFVIFSLIYYTDPFLVTVYLILANNLGFCSSFLPSHKRHMPSSTIHSVVVDLPTHSQFHPPSVYCFWPVPQPIVLMNCSSCSQGLSLSLSSCGHVCCADEIEVDHLRSLTRDDILKFYQVSITVCVCVVKLSTASDCLFVISSLTTQSVVCHWRPQNIIDPRLTQVHAPRRQVDDARWFPECLFWMAEYLVLRHRLLTKLSS